MSNNTFLGIGMGAIISAFVVGGFCLRQSYQSGTMAVQREIEAIYKTNSAYSNYIDISRRAYDFKVSREEIQRLAEISRGDWFEKAKELRERARIAEEKEEGNGFLILSGAALGGAVGGLIGRRIGSKEKSKPDLREVF